MNCRAIFLIGAVATLMSGAAYAGDANYAAARAAAGTNAMPALGPGEYGTKVDNRNNAGAATPDKDMGGANAPCIFNTDSISPIEFDIKLPAGAAGSPGTLNMNVFDVDTNTSPGNPEIDKVYVNNTYVGTLNGKDNTWGINFFNVGPGILKAGKNTVKILPDTGNPGAGYWCVAVEWGIIKVTPGTTDIVRAWVAPVRQKGGQYVNFFAEVTGVFTKITVYNAGGVAIANLTNPDKDKVWSTQWRIPPATKKGDFKFTMKGFKGAAVVSTWPAIKVQ